MKVSRFLVVLSSIIWQISWCASAAPLKCYELRGYGYPSDTTDLFVSPDGLRSGGRNGWLIWNSKAVSDFLILNPENKTYLVQPLERRWSDGEQNVHHRFRNKVMSVRKDGPSVVAGLTCTKYSAMGPDPEDPSKSVLYMEFWTWSSAPCSKAASDAWCKALAIPTGYGLPVRLRRYFRGQNLIVLDTTSAKPVAKPAEFFVISADYRRAADRAGLMFSKNGVLNAGDLDDLFISKDKQSKP